MVALLNGTVDVALAQTPLASQYVDAGDMVVLGMFSEEGIDGIEAPLAKDQGYDVTLAPTRVVLAPKGTPSEILERLSKVIKDAAESDEFEKFASDSLFKTAYLNRREATSGIQDQYAEVEPLVQQLGWEK